MRKTVYKGDNSYSVLGACVQDTVFKLYTFDRFLG